MYNGYRIDKCTKDDVDLVIGHTGYVVGSRNILRFLLENKDPSFTYLIYKKDVFVGDFSYEEFKYNNTIGLCMHIDIDNDQDGINVIKAIIEFMKKNFSFERCDFILDDAGPYGSDSAMMTLFNKLVSSNDMFIQFHHGISYWVYSFIKGKKKKPQDDKMNRIKKIEKKINDLQKEIEEIKTIE